MGKTDPKEYYKEEAMELLDNMENMLLDLEDDPENIELVNNVFRALHTVKGSGSMFGFEEIASFTHEVETVFDLVRDGKLSIDKTIIDLTLSAKDHIRALLDKDPEEPWDTEGGPVLLKGFTSLITKVKGVEPDTTVQDPKPRETVEPAATRTYRITFKPDTDIFLRGARVSLLLDELASLGRSMAIGHIKNVPPLSDFHPEQCYLSWTIILTTDASINAIKDVFIFVEDYSSLTIDVIDESDQLDSEEEYKKIGEILVEQGALDEESLSRILKRKELFGNLALEEGAVSEDNLQAALEEQQYVRNIRKQRREVSLSSTIRVKNEKLDSLIDLVGELVTLQARLSRFSEESESTDLEAISESLEHLTDDLRDNTMSIRMVPLAETFRSFNRLVRDLANDLGKEIELKTLGAETELDKTIIEQLKDPLVHLIRNSLDHGIETKEERGKTGKPVQGTIVLSAEHTGANVLIKIQDDGRGLDADKIREKGIERGLISADAEVSEKDIYSLIFAPGFSTVEKATNVSGRGVGMDVVRKNIERLRGSIDISTTPGQGTTINLKIPLTLSIIDSLLVQAGNEFYVINMSLIKECFDLSENIIDKASSGCFANVRGELVPYIDLRNLFGVPYDEKRDNHLIVANIDNSTIGIVVDTIIGQYQTVIKPLSHAFKNIEEISGSTILGDGSIAFILDLSKIADRVQAA